MDIEALTREAAAARAALDAARGKAAVAAAEARCAEACKALAAAKRAAAPAVPAVDTAAAVAAFRARQASNESAAELRRQLTRADAIYQRAMDWPRCGQSWPSDAAERAADALLRAHPGFSED